MFRGIVIAALAAACSRPPTLLHSDAGLCRFVTNAEFWGGVITPPSCDYEVRIGCGATAPKLPAEPAVIGSDPTPIQIHLGLADDPTASMVVTWRTPDDETLAGEVEIDGRRVSALTWQYTDFAGGVFRIHEAHVCGLQPDTVYDYRVHSGSLASEQYSFRTAPADAQEEVVILALGDSRGSPEVYGALLAKADEIGAPDLILYTGDAILNGSDHDAWEAFLEAGGAVLRRVPTLAAVGNHEAGSIAYFSLFAMPGDEQWYEVDYGAAHIMMLDDSSFQYPDIDGDGERFLRDRLPAVDSEQWKLVVHHQPIYSAPGFHGSTDRLQTRWAPLFDQHGVDLVFNGHDHKYERTYAMRAGARDDDNGTVYVVSGGAGAPKYSANTADWTARTFADHHFVLMRIRPSSIEATVYDSLGTVLDEFILSK